MSGPVPRLVVSGPRRHGVVRYSRELAGAVRAEVGREVALDDEAALTRSGPLHLHFTDRLWGASPEVAAGRIERLAVAAPVTVSLHDLPQASDGARNLPRRAEAYRRVADAARGVVVSSEHEAALLRDVVRPARAGVPLVVPLPVMGHPPPASRPDPDDEVALLGFFYPGKGHQEAIAAVAALAAAGDVATDGLGVTALGGAAAGHEGELAKLVAHAQQRGVSFTVTGYVEEAALLVRCRRAAVPLAAHRHVSASGSMFSWVAAGRRPLVVDGRYAREMTALRPGTLTLYAPDDLAAAIARARRDPGSTWLDDDAVLGPDLRAVATAHVAWWAEVAAR